MDQYKPSKQFIKRGSIAIVVVALLLTTQTSWFKKTFFTDSPDIVVGNNQNTAGVLTKDSNANGVSDWEERLWGLDPKVSSTNGISNKEIIETKKKALEIKETFSNSNPSDDTDRIAKELFALTSTLGQSDETDNETLKKIAEVLGDSVRSKINNTYSIKDINTITTTEKSLEEYYLDVKFLSAFIDSKSGELNVLINALENGDFGNLSELVEIADEYKKFSKEMMSIPTPIGVVEYQLGIINGFSGVGEALYYLSQIEDNAIRGLVGISIYGVYNNKIVQSLVKLEEYLTKYAII